MMFCVLMLCYFHCGAQSGLYLVIPYYVASTPEHGWTVSDLSIIFGVFNIGGIVAAQICMLSGCAKTEKNRDRILMIGHCSQFAMGIVGSMIMSGILGFNMGAFFVGAFFGGFSTDCTIIESYGTLISDSDEVQSRLLGSIGKVFLIAGIVNSFLLPAIYQHFGFGPFCGALIALEGLALITLFILWFMIHQNNTTSMSTAAGNAVTNKSTKTLEEVRDDSDDEEESQSATPFFVPLKDAVAGVEIETDQMPTASMPSKKPRLDTIESGNYVFHVLIEKESAVSHDDECCFFYFFCSFDQQRFPISIFHLFSAFSLCTFCSALSTSLAIMTSLCTQSLSMKREQRRTRSKH